MGGRDKALAVAVALIGCVVASSAAPAAPRHGISVRDPFGVAGADVWVEPADDRASSGGGARLRNDPVALVDRVWHAGESAAEFAGAEGEDTLPHFEGGPRAPTLPLPEGSEPGEIRVPVEPPDDARAPHLPDLGVLPAMDVSMDYEDVPGISSDSVRQTLTPDDGRHYRRAIRFTTAIVNVGHHSLEVLGVPQFVDGTVRVRAEQCVRFAGPRVDRSGRACQDWHPVGSLAFHAEHGHLHLDQFALYELRRDAGGRPMSGPSGLAAGSRKVGFCLGDIAWADHDHPFVDSGWYRECRHTTPHVPATVRQGISPGWADVYADVLPDQYVVVEHVPDGVYWLVLSVNTTGQLLESSRSNNRAAIRLRITGGGRNVVVG